MKLVRYYANLTENELWTLIGQNQWDAFMELMYRYVNGSYLGARECVKSDEIATDELISIFNEVWEKRAELSAIPDFDFAKYLSQKLINNLFGSVKEKLFDDTRPSESAHKEID
jgi:hypothetical protein